MREQKYLPPYRYGNKIILYRGLPWNIFSGYQYMSSPSKTPELLNFEEQGKNIFFPKR
jgi:hypothetical protein